MSTFPEPIPSPDPLDPMEGTCSHGRYADEGCGECEEPSEPDWDAIRKERTEEHAHHERCMERYDDEPGRAS